MKNLILFLGLSIFPGIGLGMDSTNKTLLLSLKCKTEQKIDKTQKKIAQIDYCIEHHRPVTTNEQLKSDAWKTINSDWPEGNTAFKKEKFNELFDEIKNFAQQSIMDLANKRILLIEYIEKKQALLKNLNEALEHAH